MKEYDLIIVGGGPAGLSAAVYAGRSLLSTLVIEAFSYGGRVNDTLEVINYPAFSSVKGRALVNDFRAHAESFSTNEFIYGMVESIQRDGKFFRIETKRKREFRAKTVILATGTKSRVLDIPGELEFTGNGVSYCATCDADYFLHKDIHILGSGDVALEAADYLSHFVNSISMIVLHDEGMVDGNPMDYEKIRRNPKVEFLWNTELTSLDGKSHIEQVTLKNTRENRSYQFHSDGVFIFAGMKPQSEFVRSLLECDEDGFLLTDEEMNTSIPGIFAAGDVRKKALRQIVTAVSDGATAAVFAERYIRKEWREE